jgi:hypothetical protein
MKRFAILLVCASCVASSQDRSGPAVVQETPVTGAPSALPGTPHSQPTILTFDDDDHGADACHGVALDDDGGFVVAGEVQRLAEGRNAWARRYTATGGVVWTYELHTPSEGSDAARGVVSLAGGAAVLAGQWYSGSPTAVNHFVTQVGANGAQWLDEGELDGSDDYASVARDASGSLVVAGARGTQAWLRELDASGNDAGWDVLDGTDASARRVAIAPSGDVLVGGSAAGAGWLARYRNHAATSTLQLASAVDDVAAVADGVAVVAGGALTLYAADGTIAWQAPSDVQWRAVAARPDGSIVVAGTAGEDLVVRIYAGDGSAQWEQTLTGAVPEAVAVNAAGDVVACGSRAGDLLAVAWPH